MRLRILSDLHVEVAPFDAAHVPADLVVLALNEAAAPALESGLQRLVQATPANASPAAATPES